MKIPLFVFLLFVFLYLNFFVCLAFRGSNLSSPAPYTLIPGSSNSSSSSSSSSGICSRQRNVGSPVCRGQSSQQINKVLSTSAASLAAAAANVEAPVSTDAATVPPLPAAAATPAATAATPAAEAAAAPGEERFPFQAEVKRVLDIIVHSLYTDKDVFLRELISNAADACDKKRVLLQQQEQQDQQQQDQQQQEQQQQQKQQWRGSIRVYADKKAGTLTIEDDGIGMSRQELIDNLGTIAQSGTYKFAQHLQQQQQQQQQEDGGVVSGANDLIGQFGVGFYSAFLVADKVEVVSSRWTPSSTAAAAGTAAAAAVPEVWKWSSSCGQTFAVQPLDAAAEQQRWQQQTHALHSSLQQQAAKGNSSLPLHERQQQQQQMQQVEQQQLSQPWTGTRVILHLREDCDDYLEDYRLKDLMKKYSEFLSVPIYLLGERVEYERVPDTEAQEAGGAPGAPKFKTVTNRFHEWLHLNTQPPIWRRPEDTLTEKDYVDFYKATFKAYDDPLAFLHMAVEGQVSFRALLFVPGTIPWELSRNMFDEDSRGIRLYVRRVFINDKFQEAVPRWLTFIRGVVDSDDLPLNVGREILQKSQMLRVVHKRIAAKAVEMIQAIKRQGNDKWDRFWENYGKYIKIGAVEDRDQQQALASLVRLHSSNSKTSLTTLDDYLARLDARNRLIEEGKHPPLPDGQPAKKQKAIYFLAAENRRAAEDSPALEGLRVRGLEVLFGVEPLDEFFLASLGISQYKGYPVIDVNKADLQLDVDENNNNPTQQHIDNPNQQNNEDKLKMLQQTDLTTKKIELGPLVEWLQQCLGPRVHSVSVSSRLVDNPAVLVQGQLGLSPTMQRYMQQQAAAQGLTDQKLFGASLSQPILEINPLHPIIKQLDLMVKANPSSESAKTLCLELFAVAALQGGYTLEEPGAFAKSVLNLLSKEAESFLKDKQA